MGSSPILRIKESLKPMAWGIFYAEGALSSGPKVSPHIKWGSVRAKQAPPEPGAPSSAHAVDKYDLNDNMTTYWVMDFTSDQSGRFIFYDLMPSNDAF